MSPIESATPHLIDMAIASRPDWDRDKLADAIGHARVNGWDWPQIALETVRLMVDEDADPDGLIAASRKWTERRNVQPDPEQGERNRRGMADVRAALRGDR